MDGFGEDLEAAGTEFQRRWKKRGGLLGMAGEAAKEGVGAVEGANQALEENVIKPGMQAAGTVLTGDPGLIPGAMAPPRGALMAAGAPSPKEQDRANTAAVAQAAVSGYHAGELGHPMTKPPAPSSSTTQPKVGTGPPLAGPKTEAQDYQSRTVPVKMPDGRTVWTDPESALAAGRAGGTPLERGEALARSGSREDVTSQYQGAQTAKGTEGTAYLRPSRKVQLPSPPDRRPFSQKIESLQATMPEIDVADPGSKWSFTGGVETGGGAPREGTRKLSGLEQATSRREWLDKRMREEQAQELEDTQAQQRLKTAQIDPLEAARIEAQGRYGGRVAEVARDVESRRSALADYTMVHTQIEKAREAMAQQKPGSPEEMALKDYIDSLEREARDRANIIAGQRLIDPRPDMWSAFSGFASANAPGGAGTPTPGAR